MPPEPSGGLEVRERLKVPLLVLSFVDLSFVGFLRKLPWFPEETTLAAP